MTTYKEIKEAVRTKGQVVSEKKKKTIQLLNQAVQLIADIQVEFLGDSRKERQTDNIVKGLNSQIREIELL
jgi:hypothetical protein